MKIAHLTSVHPRYDTRIFLKECCSLANHGFDVSLIVADGNGDEQKSGVNIFDVGKAKSRLRRMIINTKRVYAKAVELNADVYHLHDPELLPTGIKLRRIRRKVIFDSHEDVSQQILNKSYLIKLVRRIISWIYRNYESWACSKFSAIVAATPTIREKFTSIHKIVVDINNYPVLNEFKLEPNKLTSKLDQVCYVGAISVIRGIREMIKAMSLVKNDVTLALGGDFSESKMKSEVKSYLGWSKVTELGYLNREDVSNVLKNSFAGLVTLHPTLNYLDSLPVKMFEYLSAGIPVIASNFPLWRDIIEKNNCGICVNPKDPQAIAYAIDYLFLHPSEAKQMGINGRKAVENIYNWNNEEKKLVELYSTLI